MDMADTAAVSPTGEFKDRGKAIEKARAARERGLSWITSRIDRSGKPQCDPAFAYRLPWTLAVSGRRETAAAVLEWASREVLTTDGDMAPGSLRAKFTPMAASYPLAILAIGAWHLDRYDLANKIMDSLAGYQNPSSGGAYSQTPEVRGSEPLEDLYPTAQLGLAGLCTGRPGVAAGAYRWITDLWTLQPDLPDRLFTEMRCGKLVTDAGSDAMGRFYMVTDLRAPRQAFYNPGIAAAFLGRYYLATGDRGPLAAAKHFLNLSAQGGPAQFDYHESRQICKFGWGSAVLTEANPGSATYETYTLRMTQWFVESQEPDGCWHNSPFLDPAPNDDGGIAATAEFVLHLSTILTALSGKMAAEFKVAAQLLRRRRSTMMKSGGTKAVARSEDLGASSVSTRLSRRALLRYGALAGGSIFMSSTLLEACSSSKPGTAPISTGHLVGGTLRYGVLGSIVDTLNPILTVDVPEIHYLLYDRLTYFNTNLDVVLGMAQTRNVDETSGTITYELRPGQKFTDGTPVTASDVAFTFELVRRLDIGFASFYLTDFISATAVDSQTAVVKFKAVPALDPGALLPILPQHLWKGMSTAQLEKFPNSSPVGSGPFIFQQYTPNQTLSLKRNPDWWGWKAYPGTLQAVVFTSFQNPETLAEALVASDLDVTTDLPPTVWKSLAGKPSISALEYPSLLFDHLGMNVYADPNDPSKPNPKSKGNPLLLDVRVRQAVNLAVDKTTLVNVALEGTGQPGSIILMPAMPDFFAVPAADSLNYNPARANAILDAAGYRMGSSGIRQTPDGTKLSFRLVASTVDAVLAELGQLVIPMLKTVGIGISQFTTVEDATLSNLVFTEANWDMYIWTWQSFPDPTYMLSVPLTSSIGSLNVTG